MHLLNTQLILSSVPKIITMINADYIEFFWKHKLLLAVLSCAQAIRDKRRKTHPAFVAGQPETNYNNVFVILPNFMVCFTNKQNTTVNVIFQARFIFDETQEGFPATSFHFKLLLILRVNCIVFPSVTFP